MKRPLALAVVMVLAGNAPPPAPTKVAAFIERREECEHFLGEEPYDRERAAFLAKTLRQLHCERLERDERRLRQQYRNRPAVLRLLDESAG